METIDIVKKLVGPIEPLGDSGRDEERLENLKELCKLTNALVGIIEDVSFRHKNSYEYSVKKIADYAKNFLTNEIGIKE